MIPASQSVERASISEGAASRRGPLRAGASLHGILIGCGVASSVLYVAADVVGSLRYAGYSYADYTFSELLAVGSPARPLMIVLSSVPYALLVMAFAAGVWKSAGSRRAARVTALLLAAYAICGSVAGVAFPMDTREALAAGEAGFRNAMHPVGTGVMSLCLLLAMGFGAGLLGRRFRYYTYGTIVVLLVFGILTSMQAGNMTANLPTPWMGIEERVNIYATMVWVAILAVALRRTETATGAGVESRDNDGWGAAGGRRGGGAAMRLREIVARHPAATYFAMVFAISTTGVLLAIGGPAAIPGTPEQTARLFPYALMAMLAGPSISGLVLTGVVDGRAGYREFLSRLLRWRVGPGWYAVALLSVPVLAIAILSAMSIVSPAFLPDIVTTSTPGSLLLMGAAMGMLAGMFEEPGWTGFAVPRLRSRYGIVATGLIVGFLWGLWHFLVTFWGSGDDSGAISLRLLLPPLLFYVGVLPAYRLLMVWVFDRTQSLFIAMLMHGSLTACTLFILQPAVRGAGLAVYYIILTAALWAVLWGIALANGGRFSQRAL